MTETDRQTRVRYLTLAIVVLTVAVFVFDLSLPLGVAGGVPYVAVVLLSFGLSRRESIYAAATVTTVLVIAGFFLKPPGSVLWMAIVNRLLAISTIWVTAILGLIGRRTAEVRQQAERSLREQGIRLRAILDNVVEAVIVINEQGIVESFNPAAEAMFGFVADEVIGDNVKILMPAPHRDHHDAYLSNYLQSGVKKIIGASREVTGRRKDGSVFPLDLTVSEVMLDDQRLFTGVIRDISERRRLEERLLRSERLSAIGEAMSGLAHESRNALQRSQACLELLKSQLTGQTDSLALIGDIQTAQDDLHHLYEDVRAYAAPITLHPEPRDLEKLLREAWDHLESLREDKSAVLRVHHDDIQLPCEVEEFCIRQVFRNILENSLAVCEAPVEIDVRFSSSQLHSKPAVRISFRDNGPGLSPEAQRRVFEAFYTTKTHGTGLGLAICKRLIDAHGGEIEAASGHRRGAEFIITLPRAQL